MSEKRIEMTEIPYEELKGVGITQEMFDDLPQSVLDALSEGRPSPLLPMRTKMTAGGETQERQWRGRIMLFRDEREGGVHVRVAPRLKTVEIPQYVSMMLTPEQEDRLREGQAVRIPSEEGDTFCQLDKVTNQVVTTEADPVDFNLARVTEGLDAENAGDASSGTPVTVSDEDGDQVTIGVDLFDETGTGVRAAAGDTAAWERHRESNSLGRYSFGISGCWIKDADGALSYVREEDYTEDIDRAWNNLVELRRQQNITGERKHDNSIA